MGYKSTFLILVAFPLSGCAELIDPAPFEPDQTVSTFDFSTLGASATTLGSLANQYRHESAQISRGQLAFDLPLIGLAGATAGAAIGRAGVKTIAELGLAAAGVAATKSYIAPQTKASAYSGAALAFSCANSVAKQLAFYESVDNPPRLGDLDTTVGLLESAITPPPKDEAAQVAAAQKSIDDLNSARAVVYDAPPKLLAFATAIIRGATTKAQTGVQNVEAAVAAIHATSSSGSTPTSATKSTTPKPAGALALAAPSTPTKTLSELTADAENMSKDIQAAWSNLTSCTIQSTGS